MKTLVCLLVGFVALSQGRVLENDDLSGRVVNGEDANVGDRPFQVSLQQGSHFCGGSIINKNWVVTAAHCVDGSSAIGLTVVVGTVSLKDTFKTHNAEKIISHKQYNPDEITNDIALIKVAEPFEFNERVAPVPLPELHSKVKTNSSAVLSGWGRTINSSSPRPDRLQKVVIYITDPEYCRTVMQEVSGIITKNNVCANDPTIRKGQCNGDSGGPLTVDGVLTGVVSWSIKDPDCASTKYPGVYTRVAEYVDWIQEQIA